MKAVNASKSLVIVSDLKEARGFLPRLKGLIGRKRLEEGEGLWMAHCRAIHTVGMRFPIDVVFLDSGMTVRRVFKGVSPFHPIFCCLSAKGVLELPEGTIEKAKVQPGDKIEFE